MNRKVSVNEEDLSKRKDEHGKRKEDFTRCC